MWVRMDVHSGWMFVSGEKMFFFLFVFICVLIPSCLSVKSHKSIQVSELGRPPFAVSLSPFFSVGRCVATNVGFSSAVSPYLATRESNTPKHTHQKIKNIYNTLCERKLFLSGFLSTAHKLYGIRLRGLVTLLPRSQRIKRSLGGRR